MPNASTNRALLALKVEDSYAGNITGNARRLRITAEDLDHVPQKEHSGEIEPNRNRVNVLDLGASAAGSFTSELSYTDFIDLLVAAIMAGAGAADTPDAGTTRYVNGTTLKSFYLEKSFTDVGVYVGFKGCVINQLTLTFAANRPIMAQFSVMGQKGESITAARATIDAPATDAVMRCGADVGTLTLDGSAAPAAIQSLTLNITNNFTPETQVTAANPTGQNPHSFVVTGTMMAYLPNRTLFKQMLDHTAAALLIGASNAAGGFAFRLPKIQLTGGTPKIPGQDQDVMQEISFVAELGTSPACTMALEVTPAV